jgi:hypothetical protein
LSNGGNHFGVVGIACDPEGNGIDDWVLSVRLDSAKDRLWHPHQWSTAFEKRQPRRGRRHGAGFAARQ